MHQRVTSRMAAMLLCAALSLAAFAPAGTAGTASDGAAVTGGAAAQEAGVFARQDGARGVSGPLTLRSVFTLPADPAQSGFGGAWLAGVSSRPGEAPDLVAVALSRQQSGWISVWGIQLYSAHGILPQGRQGIAGTGFLAGGRYIDLYWMTGAPLWGHTLETWLSYDPDSGIAAFWIYDQTDKAPVVARQFTVGRAATPLHPAAGAAYGSAQGGAATLPLDAVSVYPAFLPRGIDWSLEVGGRRAATVDRSSGSAVLRLNVPGESDGSLRFYLEPAGEAPFRGEAPSSDQAPPAAPPAGSGRAAPGSERLELLALERAGGEQAHALSTRGWRPGSWRLVMEGVYQGEVLFAEEMPISVGQVTVALDPELAVVLETSRGPVIRGAVDVTADEWLPAGVHLSLAYDLRAPVQTVPLHDGWRAARGAFTFPLDAPAGSPEGAGAREKRFTFEIPIGNLNVDPAGREYFIEWTASVDAPIPLKNAGPSRTVAGTRPGAFEPVGEYQVLRADLHVHTTRSHDGTVPPATRAWESYMYGYDVLAITDHKNFLGYPEAKAVADEIGLVLLRAMETGLGGREEFVVVGLDSSYLPRDEHGWSPEPGRMQVYYRDQVRTVIEHGGLFIYAHPGYPPIPGDHPEASAGWTEPVAWMIENGYLHGIEVRGYAGRNRDIPYRWALEYGLAVVDVTDIHGPRDFNRGFETPHTLILAADRSPEAVLDAIRSARTMAASNGQLRGHERWVVPFIDAQLRFSPTEQNGSACVRIENRSGLLLQGTVRTGSSGTWQRLFLTPHSAVCAPWDPAASDGLVTVRFSNVWVRPDETLERTWLVK